MHSMVMLVFGGMSLNGQLVANNSIVLLVRVMLPCSAQLTGLPAVQVPANRAGQWYPDGMMVPTDGVGQPYYRNRGDMLICLNRTESEGEFLFFQFVNRCGYTVYISIMCAPHITIHNTAQNVVSLW